MFDCLCFPLFPSSKIHKLQPRSTKCVFLEYLSNHRGYKCLDLSSNKIIICHHVLFDENIFPYAKLHIPQPNTYTFLDNELSPYIIQHLMDQTQTGLPDPQPAHQPNQITSPCPNSPNITSSSNSTLPHSPPHLHNQTPLVPSNKIFLPFFNQFYKLTQNLSLGVMLQNQTPDVNVMACTPMLQNPLYLGTLCLHLKTQIGK